LPARSLSRRATPLVAVPPLPSRRTLAVTAKQIYPSSPLLMRSLPPLFGFSASDTGIPSTRLRSPHHKSFDVPLWVSPVLLFSRQGPPSSPPPLPDLFPLTGCHVKSFEFPLVSHGRSKETSFHTEFVRGASSERFLAWLPWIQPVFLDLSE